VIASHGPGQHKEYIPLPSFPDIYVMRRIVSETYQSARDALRRLPPDSTTRKMLRAVYWKTRHALRELRLAGTYLQYRIQRPVTIVVLGMHRSGTSCITRIINLCGTRVGDQLLGQMDSNERGHWEHMDALNINRDLLERSGGSWEAPPADVQAPLPIRMRMRRFLAQLHGGGQPAVWKDPRTTVTYPAWKPEVAHPVLVAIFRHPLSVAQSLRKRDGFSIERGLQLWLAYNRRLLQIADREEAVLFIDFDGGLDHIDAAIRRLTARTPLRYEPSALDFYDDTLRQSDLHAELDSKDIQEVYGELKRRAAPYHPRSAKSTNLQSTLE